MAKTPHVSAANRNYHILQPSVSSLPGPVTDPLNFSHRLLNTLTYHMLYALTPRPLSQVRLIGSRSTHPTDKSPTLPSVRNMLVRSELESSPDFYPARVSHINDFGTNSASVIEKMVTRSTNPLKHSSNTFDQRGPIAQYSLHSLTITSHTQWTGSTLPAFSIPSYYIYVL